MWNTFTNCVVAILTLWALFRLIGLPDFLKTLKAQKSLSVETERTARILLLTGDKNNIRNFIYDNRGWIKTETFEILLEKIQFFLKEENDEAERNKISARGGLN